MQYRQPLKLADSVSAFDPQLPLTLSSDVQRRLILPIADKTPLSESRAGRGKLVHGVSQRDLTTSNISSVNIETYNWSIRPINKNRVTAFSSPPKQLFYYCTFFGPVLAGSWRPWPIPDPIYTDVLFDTPVWTQTVHDNYRFYFSGDDWLYLYLYVVGFL